jgi:hypothetical protein
MPQTKALFHIGYMTEHPIKRAGRSGEDRYLGNREGLMPIRPEW